MNACVCVAASPNVKQYKKAKNVIEDDPFQVECIAWGTLPLKVTWLLRGVDIVADEHRVIYKNSSGGGRLLENATLRIEEMQFADAGEYVCVVENEYGNATATITVHVKGKMSQRYVDTV